MGVVKKAPLLGSSASVGENGSIAIEGDRRSLSRYGSSSGTPNGMLSVAVRKSAAVRRNLVARGLARQYGDQKTREENYKTQVPRYQRQQKILENYQRQQAQLSVCEKEREPAERHEDSDDNDDNDDFHENVVLTVPKRTNSAPSKHPGRPTRRMSPAVPPKGATNFLRNTNMRQLRENQDEGESGTVSNGSPRSDKDAMSPSVKLSPSESDIPRVQLRPVPRPSSSRPQKETQSLSNTLPSGPAPWLSSAHRSSRVVLRELAITKDIMMREQLVRQLKQALPLINSLTQEFMQGHDNHKQAHADLEAAKAMCPSRMKKTGSLIGITLTSDEEAESAVMEAEVAVTESNTRLAELTKRLRHHVYHVGLLINGFQQATLSVVEGILDWRQMRQRRQQMSNFQRLFRFPWRKQKIANYLLHLDEDLRGLFPSVALELLLGPKVTYSPLLLSRTVLQVLGTTSAGKTFLTERDCSTTIKSMAPTSPERNKPCNINSSSLKRLREALQAISPAKSSPVKASSEAPSSPVKPQIPAIDHDRLRLCLEAIQQERELERIEEQRWGEEELRVQITYDPFSTIKAAGGVEETLSNMMVLQSPNAQLLGEQLRIRQEDTTRTVGVTSTEKEAPSPALHVTPERLRDFFEKRAALLEPVADCEVRDVQRWGMKNKLQGKIMVRRNNEKRVEHLLARKIQRQYHAYRQRNAMKRNLADFVQSVRASVIHIQRIFRGHRAKYAYNMMRNAWLEHRRRVSAVRTIINSFRRYQRRQRHRHSMTVESIAQTQLISLLASKLNESDDAQEAAERYRRVGEERRRQRIVLLQKHKMEQQELERKRVSAAVRMQSVVRAHLAQGQAKILRQEKKAHMNAVSAMAIQSTIRKFLTIQQARRQRFRKDLERVNHSAVRIQSIYRGYNSRASLLGQLDEQTRRALDMDFTVNALDEGDSEDDGEDEENEGENEDDGEEDEEEENSSSENDIVDESLSETNSAAALTGPSSSQEDRLPPLAPSNSRPSSRRSNSIMVDEKPVSRRLTPPTSVSLPPLWVRDGSSSSLMSSASSTGTGRRISVAMMRVELKLKEAELGDKFETPPSRRSSFAGNMRHQT